MKIYRHWLFLSLLFWNRAARWMSGPMALKAATKMYEWKLTENRFLSFISESGNRVDSRLCHWREFMARVLVARVGSREKPAAWGGGGELRRFVVIGILQSERSSLGRTNTIHHVKLTTDKTFFPFIIGRRFTLSRESDTQPLRFIKKSLAKALINNSQRWVLRGCPP